MSRATFNSFLVFLLFGSIYVTANAQETSETQNSHFAGVNARGDQGMDSTTRKQHTISTFCRTGVPSRFKATSPQMSLPKMLFVVTWQ
jgi:hypothetical protein